VAHCALLDFIDITQEKTFTYAKCLNRSAKKSPFSEQVDYWKIASS